ncbi:MAG: polysaccharide biosynthesis protein [Muribaculaceae bacterium]|nr:polysaccharide biosynthesis protein [Muribaculaceae bacterium]
MSTFSTISRWYFSKKSLPYWCVFAIDCLIVFLSALFICMINTSVYYTIGHFWNLCATLGVYLVCYIVGFKSFHTYSGIIRYSSFVDLQRVASGVLLGMILAIAAKYYIIPLLPDTFIPFRLRNIILWSLLALLLMWCMRVFVKFLHDSFYTAPDAQKVFVYGTHQDATSIAKSLRNRDMSKYKLAGFVTDDEKLSGRFLMGEKIYLNTPALVDIIKKRGIGAMFISPSQSESIRNNTDLINSIVDAGVKIFIARDAEEWSGKTDIKAQQMREVEIEDLLPRDKIEVDMDAIGELLRGKCILITGAAGSIGSEIVRQVAIYNPSELVLIDQAETPLHDIRLMMAREFPSIKALTIVADIAHAKRMEEIFSEHRPEYVFHAAAYKHVPMMEDNPAEAIQNNVEGTRIIADLAVKYGTIKFVMVSTDKAVNPTNVMGCSKRLCEIYVQSLDKAIKEGKIEGKTQFVTTRFGNVLGSNGSVIPIFREQIKRGGPLTVTHPEIIRYFMLIPEACKLVLEAATMGHGGEIFVFDMGEPVKIVDLAKRMIKLSGVQVEIKFTGLRDGEKLYEEVLNEKETTLPSVHPKIMVAKVREYDYATICRDYKALVDMSLAADAMAIVRMMKIIVPEFHSQHSVYEAIDRELQSK